MKWKACSGDGDELSNSTRTFGRGKATWTGLNTRPLAMPGGLRELPFDGTLFGLSLVCSLRASLWAGAFSGVILMDLEEVNEFILA